MLLAIATTVENTNESLTWPEALLPTAVVGVHTKFLGKVKR